MTNQMAAHLEAFLQLAITIRRDHEVAKARDRDMTADHGYPAKLREYVTHVKGIVGDWESREAAQTYHRPVKPTMQAWLSRAQDLFPERLCIDEAQKMYDDQPKTEEEAFYAIEEVKRFWRELSAVKNALELQLLGIKYNLETESCRASLERTTSM